jgi:predicted acetyltransferase
MKAKLIPALQELRPVIQNLMQFYIYDFTEFVPADVETDGLYKAYPQLDSYWQEYNQRFPYIIKKDKKYIGFVLVRFVETPKRNYFSIPEFFIMKMYRRNGIGKEIAQQVFDLHKGQWLVHQRETNGPARAFWNHVIQDYTKGRFNERCEKGRTIQEFEN